MSDSLTLPVSLLYEAQVQLDSGIETLLVRARQSVVIPIVGSPMALPKACTLVHRDGSGDLMGYSDVRHHQSSF